jgi:hypothetical protein
MSSSQELFTACSQLMSEFAETRLSIRSLHRSLQYQSEALVQQRRSAAVTKETMLRQALASVKRHVEDLEGVRREKVSELETLRTVYDIKVNQK